MAAKKRILLVEDDISVIEVTRLRLEHAGYEVVIATDGEEAVRQASRNGGVNLILMDIKLPKLDGYEASKRLKADPATAAIPIIVFTASSGRAKELADKCVELGIAERIRKPFRSDELLGAVRRALGEEK